MYRLTKSRPTKRRPLEGELDAKQEEDDRGSASGLPVPAGLRARMPCVPDRLVLLHREADAPGGYGARDESCVRALPSVPGGCIADRRTLGSGTEARTHPDPLTTRGR